MRRILALALLLSLVAVACGDDAADTTTTTTVAPTTTTTAAPDFGDEIGDLISETERIRGLEFLEVPTITVLSAEQLARRVHDAIAEDLGEEELTVWQTTYELLGLLDGTVDLGAAYRDLYAEQVGGFYDPASGELVVAAGRSLSPLARSIIVHELVHALTDQHFGFTAAVDELSEAGLHDEALALHALAEGDATYFQLIYLQGLPVDQQLAAVQESLETDTAVLDALPAWFAEDLTFPYDAGFRFVAFLVEQGGVELVNQAYRQPPQTTEQILHPDRYLSREPARPLDLPDVDLPGYEVFDEGTFGAWNLGLYLLDGISAGDKAVATGGWGGDRFRVYWDGSRVAFAYLYEGDTPRDAEELYDTLLTAVRDGMGLGSGRSGGEGITVFDAGAGFAQVRLADQRLLFVVSSEAGVGSALAAGLSDALGGA